MPARVERRRTIPVAMLKPPGVQKRKRSQLLVVERAVPKALHLNISTVPASKHLRVA
jgi:hypothetical protein